MTSAVNKLIETRVKSFTDEHGHPPRVMLMVETEGTLGHSSIACTLAKRIQEVGGEIAVVSGDIDEKVFDFGGTLRELPFVHHTPENDYTPDGRLYKNDSAYQIRRQQEVTRIAREFEPDVIVVEFHPLAWKDFRAPDVDALLQYRQETGIDIPFVTMARDDVTAYPFTEDEIRNRLKSFSYVLAEGWEQPNPCPYIEPAPEYLGHILEKRIPDADPLPPEMQPVMVFSSGGFQPTDYLFFEKAIEACSKSAFAGRPWKIILAQDCPDDVLEYFQTKAAAEGNGKITVTRVYDNDTFSRDMSNCAAAIVRGSYNTTLELASQEKPFVIIPRSLLKGWAFENENRAQFFSENGLATTITEAELATPDGAENLAAALLEATLVQPTQEFVYGDGSQFATRLLQIAMQPKRSLQREEDTLWTGRNLQPENNTALGGP